MGSSRGSLYEFDDDAVGSSFAVSRVIEELRGLLEKYRERIREYCIVVGCSEGEITADSASDIRDSYATVLLPDACLLITSDAYARLSSYVAVIPLENSGLFCYSGQKTLQYAVPTGTVSRLRVVAYPSGFGHPVGALVEMLSSLDPENRVPRVAEVERENFAETCNARDMYLRLRFATHQPEYRVSACVDHAWYVLRALASSAGTPVEIAYYADRPKPEYLSLLADKLGDQCRVTEIAPPEYMPADLKNIPADVLELSYLVYRSRRYLCNDDIPGFFASMDKQREFVIALGNWMYSFGLLSDPADFRSVNPALESRIRDALGGRTVELDRHIARWLWSMYERGSLQSDFSLYEIFESLSFSVSDMFLVGCLYSTRDTAMAARATASHFRDPEIPESVLALETARGHYKAGNYDESMTIAKNVLHAFQKANVLPGEYRALSLVAMLSLARKRPDDAIVYLEYALENAERMHDPRSGLATRFFMAVTYFISNDYHFALCTLESVDKIVESCYAKDWEVLILFMKGRILFELGNYTDAELMFQTASSLASVYQIPESVSLSRVWYARSLAHEGRYATAETILRDCASAIPEASIYLLEMAIIAGHPLADVPPAQDFPSDHIDYDGPDSFSWRSSYAIAENLAFGSGIEEGIADRMYAVFALIYRQRFDSGADNAIIARDIDKCAREAMDASDPYASLYHYFCYEISKSPNHESPDTLVYLSKAFKFMQKRANEIEDNGLREQFMQNPTWNSRLYRAARGHMLI